MNNNSDIINIIGILGFIGAIFSLLFSFIPCIGLYAFIPSGISLITSIICYFNLKQLKEKTGLTLAGTIISIIALIIAFTQFIIFFPTLSAIDRIGNEFDEALQEELFKKLDENIEKTKPKDSLDQYIDELDLLKETPNDSIIII